MNRTGRPVLLSVGFYPLITLFMSLRFLLLCCTLCSLPALHAQSIDDLLRYSEVGTFGTARSLGTGNSMSAIGAEWTAVQSNPAGLAAFRQNEFTITLGGLIPGTSNSRLMGANSTDAGSDLNFALPQVALVFTTQPIGSRWTQLNFGFGVSQTNRFEENIVFSGRTPGSISDQYLESSNVLTDTDQPVLAVNELNNFTDGLAYDAFLLNPFGGTDPVPEGYFTDYDDRGRTSDSDPGVPLFKSGNIERTGKASSFDINFGGNFEERFFIGATFGIASSNFEETNVYREDDVDDEVPTFVSVNYVQSKSIDGTGLLGRVGVIYRANQALRLGLAYHSPTVTWFTDNYTAQLDYTYIGDDGAGNLGTASPEADVLEYRITTPSRYRASAAGIIGRTGFVSAELGYIDYTGATLRYTGDFDFSDDENALDEVRDERLQSAIQLRVGGELNIKPFQARAGFEYLGAPLQGEEAALGYSVGLGYRRGRLALDAAYKLSVRPDRIYRPYDIQTSLFPEAVVEYTPTLSSFALTFAWKLTRAYDMD